MVWLLKELEFPPKNNGISIHAPPVVCTSPTCCMALSYDSISTACLWSSLCILPSVIGLSWHTPNGESWPFWGFVRTEGWSWSINIFMTDCSIVSALLQITKGQIGYSLQTYRFGLSPTYLPPELCHISPDLGFIIRTLSCVTELPRGSGGGKKAKVTWKWSMYIKQDFLYYDSYHHGW